MRDSYEGSLSEAAAATFEELAYSFAERTDPQAAPTADDGVSTVSFSGPVSGRIVVAMGGGALPSLTANMLGQEEAPPAAVQRDALGEVANVICGNVLPRVAGSTAVFALGTPHVEPSWAAACARGGAPAAHVAFTLEGGRADIALFLEAGDEGWL
jgi:CheY-specific phosphatase CheX